MTPSSLEAFTVTKVRVGVLPVAPITDVGKCNTEWCGKYPPTTADDGWSVRWGLTAPTPGIVCASDKFMSWFRSNHLSLN